MLIVNCLFRRNVSGVCFKCLQLAKQLKHGSLPDSDYQFGVPL